MAKLKVYKRNPKFIDLVELVEDISSIGLVEGLENTIINPMKRKLKVLWQGLVFYNS